MADDRTKADAQDRDRINVNERYELDYWSNKWGVSHEELKNAVAKAGVRVKDVARQLGKTA